MLCAHRVSVRPCLIAMGGLYAWAFEKRNLALSMRVEGLLLLNGASQMRNAA